MAEHTHTYIRVRGRKELYMCNDPDCKNPATKREFLEGKRANCGICGRDFILTREQLRNKTPRCIDCRRVRPKKEDTQTMENLLNQFGGGPEDV